MKKLYFVYEGPGSRPEFFTSLSLLRKCFDMSHAGLKFELRGKPICYINLYDYPRIDNMVKIATVDLKIKNYLHVLRIKRLPK